MELELLAWTPQPERTCAAAARLCTSDSSLQTIWQGLSEERVKDIIARVLKNGHLSILEHASFTFAAIGLSRVCTHQLVRHRVASFAQQSQRHLPARDRTACGSMSQNTLPGAIQLGTSCGSMSRFVTPPSLRGHGQAQRLFREACSRTQDIYEQLLILGIPSEDARYVLPQASATRILFTMNARELHHFLRMRCCEKAQWEIRGLAWLVRERLLRVAPGLFSESGPACFQADCPEHDYACWREKSAFFQSSYHIFRERLQELGLTLEERRLPAACLHPSTTSKMLGCRQEELLRPILIECGDRWALLLSAKPENALAKVNARTNEEWRLAAATRYRKLRVSFMACPWLFTNGKEQVTAFWDNSLDCQGTLVFNLASAWRFATLPPRCIEEMASCGGCTIEKV
ncbi:MAG: FAD-dependent thymidylate synthase [bacterium]